MNVSKEGSDPPPIVALHPVSAQAGLSRATTQPGIKSQLTVFSSTYYKCFPLIKLFAHKLQMTWQNQLISPLLPYVNSQKKLYRFISHKTSKAEGGRVNLDTSWQQCQELHLIFTAKAKLDRSLAFLKLRNRETCTNAAESRQPPLPAVPADCDVPAAHPGQTHELLYWDYSNRVRDESLPYFHSWRT